MKNAVKNPIDSDSKLFALLGIVLTIVGFILVMFLKKDNKYVIFYAKQGLVLFIAGIIVGIIGWVLDIIPLFGRIITGVLWILIVILWMVGLIYSLSGEEKDIPIIGAFAQKIDV